MAAKDSSDISSDGDSSEELEIKSDGVICPFMFEPRHGTSSEDKSDSNMAQDPPQAVKYTTAETSRSRLGNRVWCTCTNCQVSSINTCLTYFLFWDITKDAGDSVFLEWGFPLMTCNHAISRMD